MRWMRGKTHVRGVYNAAPRLGKARENEIENAKIFDIARAAKASGREMLGSRTKKGMIPHNLGSRAKNSEFISTDTRH